MKKVRCNKNTMMGALVVVLGLCIVYLVYTHKTSIIEGAGPSPADCAEAQNDCNQCEHWAMNGGDESGTACNDACAEWGKIMGQCNASAA